MVVERVGVSFEPELLKKFDVLIRKKGYNNRSEAIRDLIRKMLIESEVKENGVEVIGAIGIIYNHDKGNVTNRLLHLQHQFSRNILSTAHIHMNKRTCFEVLIVRGSFKKLKNLADNINALKGVNNGELFIATKIKS